jgi:hypothetical protein
MERVRRVYSRAPLKGLLRRSQGRSRGAIICGSFKMVLVPLFFTEKSSPLTKCWVRFLRRSQSRGEALPNMWQWQKGAPDGREPLGKE